ncbi:hypothetical protein HMPREF1381_01886, partial [Enterococcus faecium R501]
KNYILVNPKFYDLDFFLLLKIRMTKLFESTLIVSSFQNKKKSVF